MELFHVFHFESTGEELLYMLNIYKMLSFYDQVIHINDDKQVSSRVAPDEQRVVRLGLVQADLVKIFGYLQMPGSGCLLEAIERRFQSTYH